MYSLRKGGCNKFSRSLPDYSLVLWKTNAIKIKNYHKKENYKEENKKIVFSFNLKKLNEAEPSKTLPFL